MVRDRSSVQTQHLIWGWMIAGSAVASAAAVIAASVTSLRRMSAGQAGMDEQPAVERAAATRAYAQNRISGVRHTSTLHAVAPVPPENPHAPPTPSVGTPIVHKNPAF